jgi:hypothetical protein
MDSNLTAYRAVIQQVFNSYIEFLGENGICTVGEGD